MMITRETTYECGEHGEYVDSSFYPVHVRKGQRRKLGKPTSEVQALINETNAVMHLCRLINHNFEQERDIHMTLTYRPECTRETRAQAVEDARRFLRRVKYRWKKRGIEIPLRYIFVAEGGDGQRIHVHLIITGGISREELEQMWGMGWANGKRLIPTGDGYMALAKYLSKQGRLGGERRWYGSKRLVQPEPKEKNGQVSAATVEELAREVEAAEVAIPLQSTADRYAVLEQMFPGYYYAGGRAVYNEIDRRYYVHIRLYKMDSYAGRAETRRRREEETQTKKRLAGARSRNEV